MSTEAGCQLDAAHPINLDAQLFHLPICLSWHCTTDSAILCCLNLIHSSLYESWDLPLVLVSQVVTASMHPAPASELLESSCVLCHFVFEVYFSHWVSNLTGHWGYTWLNTETSQAPVSWQHTVHAALCCVAANWHFHGIRFVFFALYFADSPWTWPVLKWEEMHIRGCVTCDREDIVLVSRTIWKRHILLYLVLHDIKPSPTSLHPTMLMLFPIPQSCFIIVYIFIVLIRSQPLVTLRPIIYIFRKLKNG